ncbi:MAG: lactate permease [Thermoleophilaceae bacterium]|jgi:lactate permease|nr:lactate permease [Thermoleophilaceae bacterium]MEA2438141.1 lactate permease [Thermoleophilaceae bacterium]
MYQQVYDPVSNSLGVSSIFAALPLLTLFVLLGGVKMKAQWAGLISLAVALIVSIAVYSMPVGQAFDSAAEGAAFGLFPIMWIVVNAVWIYTMTVKTGDFAVLRRSFASISSDQRIQAVIIAFAFGALLEALAGFGTPVAITSVMLIALGFKPIKAASVALVANTAPVAFGAIAIPIVTLSQVTGLDKQDLGSMVGRQTPFVALIVPFILVFIVDGMRGIRQTWPVVFVGAFTFGLFQFLTSNYVSVELTDIAASLMSVFSMVLFLQIWQPSEPLEGESAPGGARPAIAGASVDNPAVEREAGRRDDGKDSFGAVLRAYAPYLIIIAVFAIAQIGPVKDFLANRTEMLQWPGLHITNGKGKDLMSLTYKFDWAAAAGSLLLVCGVITALVLRIRPRIAFEAYRDTLDQLKWAILTVAAVLALAYVMNQSGQTTTIGMWAAGAGSAFAFLSPLIGWLGTAITGSDTSSNSLFGVLQVTAAKDAGLNPILLAAGNSSGGVLGKMISPQNLAIGAAAVGMAGEEGELFRKVLKWSLIMVAIMAVLVLLQSKSVLDWMVVKP